MKRPTQRVKAGRPAFLPVDSAILAGHGPQRAVLAAFVASSERLGLNCSTERLARTFRCDCGEKKKKGEV